MPIDQQQWSITNNLIYPKSLPSEMGNTCLICKTLLVDKSKDYCERHERFRAAITIAPKLKEDFFGSAPAPFVGEYGYPRVNVGILSTIEHEQDAWMHDAPQQCAAQNYGISEVVNLRSSLVNSRFQAGVSDVRKSEKFLDISKEVGMSSKPVDVEINLKKNPFLSLNFDNTALPRGPPGELVKAQVTENPSISRHVDRVHDDTNWKAKDAMSYLYKHGYDENFLTRILSVGTIGMQKDRKLVPTKWSITAVDDSLGKELITKIKDYQTTDNLAYFGGYLGNYYLILFFPEVWQYELFEMYVPNNPGQTINHSTDFESFSGRRGYAFNTQGGYYAARLAIAEKLFSMKRQASVLALRVIREEYDTPLGVWVVRQATRKALESAPIIFGDKELMIKYASAFLKKKFGFDVGVQMGKSILLQSLKNQKRSEER